MTAAGTVCVSESTEWSEICRRLPGQWVVLVAIDWTDDDGNDIRTAFVAGYARDRREARAEARTLLAEFDEVGTYFTSSPRVPALPPILHTMATPIPEPRVGRVMHHLHDLLAATKRPAERHVVWTSCVYNSFARWIGAESLVRALAQHVLESAA
jgi:hypothetical protein